ncbi:cytokinesis protein 3 [Actinomortierella ambigua]|nr:cytokinesis protein 3 [Actinomortierella ambigua]
MLEPASRLIADKLARNVNQKSSQLTPVLLSQKYLTRPYARSPLLKLRVLFIWVSENIRLEGGAMRDVSGGRYKLGPAGDVASTYHPSVNGNISPVVTSVIAKAINETLKASSSPPNPRRTPASSSTNLAAAAAIATLSPNGSNGAGNSLVEGTPSSPPFVVSAATAAAFLQGMDDCSKGFLMEDEPESAQEVLTNRVCRTGEGFANLFAEMAVAAGIEDVGVVKGYLKGPMDVFAKEIPPPNHAWNVVKIDGVYRFIDCCLASPFYPGNYPNKSKEARSFYFLTPPSDMILTHFPTFLTYQYIAPPITSSIFLQLPFVRPAFFEFGLRFLDFKKRTRLEIKDDQPVEVFIVIGAGEGVDLRAEVEAMTAEGKVSKKRALAQVTIWRPNPNLLSSLSGSGISPDGEDVSATASTMSTTAGPYPFSSHQGTKHGLPASQLSALATAAGMTAVGSHGANGIHPGSPSSGRLGGRAGAGLCGIRIAKIKAVLPTETVKSVGGIRKGVLHIYAGRKVENALTDAIPYALAVSLPIRHTGTLPRTPFSFVLPHFSPYEYYIKAPQTELLYYPHTYKFSIVSLAALSQATSTPLPSPIQWADYSPSTSAVFDSHPITPNGSSVLQHAQSPSSATSPPPLATKRSAGVGSSTTSMTGSPKVTTTDLASSPSNGSYASTLSGAKPSHLSQRRASHHYTGSSSSSGTSGQVSLPPPVPAVGSSTVTTATTHVTATQATPAMTMTLGPYGAVLSTSSRLKQHSSSSSLASPSRVSQHYNHTPRHGHPPLHPSSHNNHSASSLSATLGTGGGGHVRRHSSSSACSISPSAGGAAMSASSVFAQSIGHPAVARPERLVLRSQTNRIYKLVYDPVRQCHEAQMEIKERGLWECVRLDDGGKGRVGREGAGGVVIASWRCV